MEPQQPSARPPATEAAPRPEGTSLPDGAWQVDLLAGGPELIDGVRDEWIDLCARSARNPWYCRPEWVRAYVAHFRTRGGVRLVTARRGGELHAVLPLLARRLRACGLPARRLRSAADDKAWRFDLPLTAGEPGDEALAAIVRQLPQLGGWDYLELRDVPEGGSAEALARLAGEAGCAVTRVPSMRSVWLPLGGWDGDPEYFLKRASGRFRNNMRRALKRVGKELRLERLETFEPEAFGRFLELEASGWKGKSGGALATDARALAYFRELFGAIASAGEFVMKLLWAGDDLLAAVCAIEHDGCHVHAKCAANESFRKLAPGHLLVHAALLDCAERGMREFDFAGIDEEWKLFWEPETLDHHTHYIFRPGLYGRALHAAKFKVSPALKRLRGSSASAG